MKTIKAFLLSILLTSNVFAIDFDLNEAKTISTKKIIYNTKTGNIQTKGNTEIVNESGNKLVMKDSVIDKNNTSTATDIELWLGENIFISADNITKKQAETIAINASFTACNNCGDLLGNAWTISGTTIKHNQTDKMLYFHNSVVWIYDTLPVFYLPYYQMPDPSVKYKSGVLMPSFGSTNKMGTQINLPIYFNFSYHHDTTVTLSYLTQENPLFQLNHRLNMSHAEFKTNGSFTHNKEGKDRWHVFNDDIIELGEHARANINIHRTSDKTYLQKYDFYNDEPYLDTTGNIELFAQSGYLTTEAHIFQELRSTDSVHATPSGDILPNIHGTYQTQPLFENTFLTFSADGMAISGDGFYNQRLIGETRIVSPWTLWGGNRITASIATRYDVYNFNKVKMYDGDIYSGIKTRFLPNGYLEWGLPLFNTYNSWTHTIEPRARLTIMQHDYNKQVFALNNDSAGRFLSDATLFSNNRFSGLDVWENGNFADYGVRWNAFNQNNNIEVFVGQSYDFTNKGHINETNGFHKGLSDYVSRISYTLSDLVKLSSRLRFDKSSADVKHSESTVQVGRHGTFLNLGHIWNTEDIDNQTLSTNEIIGSVGLNLTTRWQVKFHSTYNIENKLFQRHGGGIFYNHPCYYASLEYRRDNSIKEDYVGGTSILFNFGVSIEGKHY
ncbi:MAG: LPS assembly protein LptD [Alphaproteobacteria bacterium]|nr:LPS assembly protein LptD [Alphaproteobacteria bacterium]